MNIVDTEREGCQWIQLEDGQAFYYEPCNPSAITVENLSYALARKCRFGGHCKRFYSVAQHSILVARMVPSEFRLAALLHDAHEALSGFGDILSPIKRLMPLDVLNWYRGHIEKVDRAVCERFGLEYELLKSPTIVEADLRMLATEKEQLMRSSLTSWGTLPPPYQFRIRKMKKTKVFEHYSFLLDAYSKGR